MSRHVAVPEPAQEPLSRKKLLGAAIFAGGVTLLLVGRSTRGLLRRLEASAQTPPSVRKPRLKDLSPSTKPPFDFIGNRTVEPPQPSWFKFLLSGLSDDNTKPLPRLHDFNPAVDAMKALGIATFLTVSTFGLAGYALLVHWQAYDMATFRIKLKEEMPKLLKPFVPTPPAFLKEYKFEASKGQELDEDALSVAYQKGGIKAWAVELDRQQRTPTTSQTATP